jgi:hypothetical protein
LEIACALNAFEPTSQIKILHYDKTTLKKIMTHSIPVDVQIIQEYCCLPKDASTKYDFAAENEII